MEKEEYDLIVLGAGTAGCLASYTAAKEGLRKVALIDRKPREKIGKKVCGDGLGTKHINFLSEIGFPIKEQEVIINYPKTAHIISPNNEHDVAMEIKNQLAIIDRYKLGQTLLTGTLDVGVRLYDKTKFKSIARKEGKVQVKLEREEGGNALSLTAPLIIDGTGFNSQIRKNSEIFGEMGEVKDDEQYVCFREICQIDPPPERYKNSAVFEFSFEVTKGGYMWYFHRKENEFNMGVGIPKTWVKQLSPRSTYQKYMENRFKKGQILDSGGGVVPTRHPLPTHVKDNIILIGDAGSIVNPLHGGGLGSSIASGYIAGKLAVKQVPDEALTESDLWTFNLKILQRYGLRYAMLDLYRILLQNISDEELNETFSKEYFPLGKIFYAREYELLLKLSRGLGKIWEQLPNNKFNLLPQFIERVSEATNNYPKSPENLNDWARGYEQIYSDYQQKIRKNSTRRD